MKEFEKKKEHNNILFAEVGDNIRRKCLRYPCICQND